MAAIPSSMPSSMFTSTTWAPFSTCSRQTSSAVSYSPSRIRRLKRAEPVMLARLCLRSRTAYWLSIFRGSSPDRRQATGISDTRGRLPSTACAMAEICGGVLPQQPPTMLTKPASAHSPICPPISSGVRSNPPNSLADRRSGRPRHRFHTPATAPRHTVAADPGPGQLRLIASGCAWRRLL